MTDFPPSSDMVEFEGKGGKVSMFCLICGTCIKDDVRRLNEALVVWEEHRKEMKRPVQVLPLACTCNLANALANHKIGCPQYVEVL
jgi:hypothetical protein